MSKYYSPAFATLHFQAVWTVNIAYKRSAEMILRRLKKLLRPKLGRGYEPSMGSVSGYQAEVLWWSMEEGEELWPDW